MTEHLPDQWGPWIYHDGTGCPAALLGKTIDVIGDDPSGRIVREVTIVNHLDGRSWDWSFWGAVRDDGAIIGRIVRYRIRRDPDAIFDDILRDVEFRYPADLRTPVPRDPRVYPKLGFPLSRK